MAHRVIAVTVAVCAQVGCGEADQPATAPASSVADPTGVPPSTSVQPTQPSLVSTTVPATSPQPVTTEPAPSTAPSTIVPTSSAPSDPTIYRTVGGVIEESPHPPMIVFVQLDSLPPQVGSGIPIVGWSWDLIDGESTRRDTTWIEQQFEFVGTWDGTAFTLTEPPRHPSDTDPGPTHNRLTPDCDTSRWLAMLDQLDLPALGVVTASDDQWDGRCGVEIHAVTETPELRAAIEPFGDHITVTYALEPLR
jgi:hypothetical protein